MSDQQPPDSSHDGSTPGRPERPERPEYGEYAPPGWTAPEPQEVWPTAAAPPVQPGLIPLRPLFLADVIAGAFKTIRRSPRPTFWFALALGFVANVVSFGIVALVMVNTLGTLDPGVAPEIGELRSALTALALSAVGVALVQIVLIAIPQAVVTLEVARATLGERLTLRALWARARGRVGALIGWLLIFGGISAILILLTVLGLAELALTGGLVGAVTAVGIGILLGLGFVVMAFWLGTKLAFVPALIVIERLPLGQALRRSWALTQGSFWRILGISLLMALIVQVGAQIVMTPVALLSSAFGPAQQLDAGAIVVLVVGLVLQVVVSAVAVVLQAAVPTLLYLDVRMRREGLDTVLREHANAKSAGATPVADPFD